MKSFSMKNFEHKYAWEHRNDVLDYVFEGTKIILDNKREYKVKRIDKKTGDGYESDFILEPINDTLKDYKRDYDTFRKKK